MHPKKSGKIISGHKLSIQGEEVAKQSAWKVGSQHNTGMFK